jgi:hypothetical protein
MVVCLCCCEIIYSYNFAIRVNCHHVWLCTVIHVIFVNFLYGSKPGTSLVCYLVLELVSILVNLLFDGYPSDLKNPAGYGYGGDLDPMVGMGAGGRGGDKGRVQVWGCQTRPQTRRVSSGGRWLLSLVPGGNSMSVERW